MDDKPNHSDPLFKIVGAALCPEILYCFKATTGQLWAEVTRAEAEQMWKLAEVLRRGFPNVDWQDGFVTAKIEEGDTARTLLEGYLNADVATGVLQ